MTNLLIATLFFVGSHLGVSSTLRTQLIDSVGERTYRTLYSLVSAVGIVWMVMAYRSADFVYLFPPLRVFDWLAILLMPVAFVLLVAALTGPNPTAVGQQLDADAGEPATGIIRITRHPLMWGITIWALLHILASADVASLIFFGGFKALALLGMIALDARKTDENAPGWGVFVQSTSVTPFAAIREKRQRIVWHEIGWKPVIIAAVLYILFLVAHPWLFGAAAVNLG